MNQDKSLKKIFLNLFISAGILTISFILFAIISFIVDFISME